MALMDDEIEMLVSDGVSPINSENKWFFLDFYGLKRNHDCFMNFFAHENLQDVNTLPSYDITEVFNKDPALYKTSFDEHGHVIKIHEIPPCIFIDKNEDLMNLMRQSDGSYKLPSSISYLEYEVYCQKNSILMTNIIYLIPKITKETSIQTIINNETVTLNNANNGYYEYIITSIEWNNSTGKYDINWEMLGGKEGDSGSAGNISFSNLVKVTTLSEDSEATASVEILSQTEEAIIYQLNLGIPKGKSGDSVKLRVENNILQYKMESDTIWTNLYELENLRGIGISNIEKTESSTESSGKNTIQITMSDGQTFSFDVYNGAKGENGQNGQDGTNGEDGVSISNASLSEIGHLILEFSNGNSVDVGLVKGQDGTNGQDGQNGQDGTNGADGIGISKIEFTSSNKGSQAGLAGATDTYTITFTDNNTTTFIVYNGKNGTDGSITVDDAMSDTSTNTVQNMVIKKYVDDIVGDIQTVLATLTTLSEGGN